MKVAKVSLIKELKVELNNLEKLKRKFNSLVGEIDSDINAAINIHNRGVYSPSNNETIS